MRGRSEILMARAPRSVIEPARRRESTVQGKACSSGSRTQLPNLSFILLRMPVRSSTPERPAAVSPARPGHATNRLIVQFAKFAIVGISNTLITFAVYTLLLKGFGVWYLAASAIGFIAGAVNGFLLNRRWTFRGHVGDALTPVRWFVVQGCGLALNEGLLYLYVDQLGLDKLIGQALSIAVVTVITFFVNRAWTFRMSAAAAVAGEASIPADGQPALQTRGVRQG
jgi:putative flippase GtrA